jgi:hypothetical protein
LKPALFLSRLIVIIGLDPIIQGWGALAYLTCHPRAFHIVILGLSSCHYRARPDNPGVAWLFRPLPLWQKGDLGVSQVGGFSPGWITRDFLLVILGLLILSSPGSLYCHYRARPDNPGVAWQFRPLPLWQKRCPVLSPFGQQRCPLGETLVTPRRGIFPGVVIPAHEPSFPNYPLPFWERD